MCHNVQHPWEHHDSLFACPARRSGAAEVENRAARLVKRKGVRVGPVAARLCETWSLSRKIYKQGFMHYNRSRRSYVNINNTASPRPRPQGGHPDILFGRKGVRNWPHMASQGQKVGEKSSKKLLWAKRVTSSGRFCTPFHPSKISGCPSCQLLEQQPPLVTSRSSNDQSEGEGKIIILSVFFSPLMSGTSPLFCAKIQHALTCRWRSV